MKETNKHTVIRVDNLMYKGCEPHWKCTKCGVCIPFHCYSKQALEEKECVSQKEGEKCSSIKNWK